MTERHGHSDSAGKREENPQPSGAAQAVRLFERLRHRAGPGDGDRLFGGDASTPHAHRDDTDIDAVDEFASIDTPSQIGRFQVLRRLGEGGFGVVFLANDPQLNRRVALKLPGPGVLMQPELLRRFLREGEAAAALDHPHIVPVYEAGHVGAVHYIASAYIEGMPLSERLAQRTGPIEPQAAARLVAVLADAVQHAHSRGVLHRDLKPANVLLERVSGESGDSISAEKLSDVARLTDFGLAKLIDAERRDGDTGTQAVLGTPAYMAPEQAEGRNRDVGTAADVFALGAILYELLTGEPPFKRESHVATLKAVCGEEAVPPSKRDPSVPADLEAICLKCLEKPIERRYATAAALADDLQRFLSGGEVSARRIGRGERLRRWTRRNPGLALLSGTAMLLALALLIGTTSAAILLEKANRQTSKHLAAETEAKDDARQQARIAKRAQYESYVRQAQLSRRSGRPGQKLETLRVLKLAAKLRAEFDLGDEQRKLLRHEWIACLALPDVAPESDWPLTKSNIATVEDRILFDVDGNIERYAVLLKDRITVRRMKDNVEIASFRFREKSQASNLRFSPDGKWLAFHLLHPEDGPRTHVGTIATGEIIDLAAIGIRSFGKFEFNPDGKTIMVAGKVCRLPGFEVVARTRTGSQACASPYGDRVAVQARNGIEIRRIRDGKVLSTIPHKIRRLRMLKWSPKGKRLAVAGWSSVVQVWNIETGKLENELRHDNWMIPEVPSLDWHPGGRYIVTAGMDENSQVWDLTNNRVVLKLDQVCNRFSIDGRRLGGRGVRYEFHSPSEPMMIPQRINVQPSVVPHPDGRWLMAAFSREVAAIDLTTGTEVARHDVSGNIYRNFRFSFDGESAFMTRDNAVIRMPVEREESRDSIRWTIGPQQTFLDRKLSFLSVGRSFLAGLTIRDKRPLVKVVGLTRKDVDEIPIRSTQRAPVYYGASPDGRFVATAHWHKSPVHIHRLPDGRRLHDVGDFYRDRCIEFHPEGKLLAVCDRRQLCVFDPSTGRRRFRIASRDTSQRGHYAVFSADGRLLAHTIDPFHIQLRDTGTFVKVAEFPVPEQLRIIEVRFTPDGRRLLAVTQNKSGYAIFVWNLGAIRSRLAAMKLDWNHPPIEPPPASSKKRLRVVRVPAENGQDR